MRTILLSVVAAALLAAEPGAAPSPAAAPQAGSPQAGSPQAGTVQTERSPEALARALDARYAGIRDFSADFTQIYKSGLLRRAENRQRGSVKIKKPGRVRWVYTDPDPQEVVSDGVRTYVSLPEDNLVYVQDVPTGEAASTADLFLSGRGNISGDFTPKIVQSPVDGTVGLELTPVKPDTEYERLILALEPRTLQIRGLVSFDLQGGESTIRFDNLKENTGLDDADFNFRIPRGADVQFN